MTAPLIVIEGIDGSGKGTQAARLGETLARRGLTVGRLDFPRYDANRFGGLIGRFLNGEFGPLDAVAPELAALLFAGDRLESRGELDALRRRSDVVVLDRYVASNVAHQAGRLDGDRRRELVAFLDWLEHDLHAMPRATATVWLDLPPDIARRRVAAKAARSYTDREADIQEDDAEHLGRAASVYATISGGPGWHPLDVAPGGRELTEDDVAAAVMDAVEPILPAA